MRIALINQTFYPDIASSGQHLADLARRLAERGHTVTVVTSRRGYDAPDRKFPGRETWRGVKIVRVWNTGFGKGAKWKRAANFATFLMSCCWRLLCLGRQDVVVAMTSPPLVSVLAACFARLRGARFCYWVMDLNPDEALAAGWLASGSLAARWLERFSRFSLLQASAVVVLDRFMERRILDKGVAARNIFVIPPWSHDAEVRFDPGGRTRLRRAHGFTEKFLVMYSGNHSPCHPLTTVLGAAESLSARDDIAFCFVGGGVEFGRVRRFAAEKKLSNVTCLPYQPLSELAGALSAADLHVVVMGEAFVGIVHPCKAYNILRVGSPLLYVGPEPSHISEMLGQLNGEATWRRAAHGDVDAVVRHILDFRTAVPPCDARPVATAGGRYSEESLLPRLVNLLEGVAAGETKAVESCREGGGSGMDSNKGAVGIGPLASSPLNKS
jgi:colanic acid biosynthesis glycosyl transferase WcaI